MDLPAVQRLTGRPGSLSRIEFIADDGPNAEARRGALKGQLELWSQGRWVVSSPTDRRDSAATMTRAFRLNLTILSLLALLVGLYLIFQALDGAVVRRREEIGILRSLGVEEQAIRSSKSSGGTSPAICTPKRTVVTVFRPPSSAGPAPAPRTKASSPTIPHSSTMANCTSPTWRCWTCKENASSTRNA
jgi:hypothetical protein